MRKSNSLNTLLFDGLFWKIPSIVEVGSDPIKYIISLRLESGQSAQCHLQIICFWDEHTEFFTFHEVRAAGHVLPENIEDELSFLEDYATLIAHLFLRNRRHI